MFCLKYTSLRTFVSPCIIHISICNTQEREVICNSIVIIVQSNLFILVNLFLIITNKLIENFFYLSFWKNKLFKIYQEKKSCLDTKIQIVKRIF